MYYLGHNRPPCAILGALPPPRLPARPGLRARLRAHAPARVRARLRV